MSGTYHNLKLHMVFSTAGREPWLQPAIRPRVHQYLGGTIKGEGGVPLEIGGVTDHVHALFGWRTDQAISVLARNLKANSSKWIHETFADLTRFRWQEGYSVFSVSQSQVDRVRQYIQRQEEHHRVKSFREELIEFLDAHQVAYKPEYLD